MKKILITRDLPQVARKWLEEEGFIVSAWIHERPMNPDELISAARTSDAMISLITDRIDDSFLQECLHLDIISQCGAGYDNIDLAAATRVGIPIANTPDAMSEATADIAFGLMIAVSRKMFYLHKSIEKGEWGYFKPKAHLGIELRNKTLGVFGMGRIGMAMARRCQGAFGMEIIYCNRHPNQRAEAELKARFVGFEELLKLSDVLSVHCVLSDETRGIFNRSAFEKMQPSSIFINTSRGLVHQEEDLIEAIKKGQIWGAGLDVTNPEPMRPTNPLLAMETVAVLPHVGSGTMEARTEMARSAAENIIEFYKGKPLAHLLNPQVLSPGR
jgi:glyoxylate reductase